MDRPGVNDIQLDFFLDYRKNLDLYPAFHKYFSERQPPVLAIWGKHDQIFVHPGAEAFKTVLKDVEVQYIEGGHFVLENHLDEMTESILKFLAKNKI